MKIIARINFTLNGVKYLKDEEVNVTSYKQIVKLNELGFIYPLSYEDLVQLERELKKED